MIEGTTLLDLESLHRRYIPIQGETLRVRPSYIQSHHISAIYLYRGKHWGFGPLTSRVITSPLYTYTGGNFKGMALYIQSSYIFAIYCKSLYFAFFENISIVFIIVYFFYYSEIFHSLIKQLSKLLNNGSLYCHSHIWLFLKTLNMHISNRYEIC